MHARNAYPALTTLVLLITGCADLPVSPELPAGEAQHSLGIGRHGTGVPGSIAFTHRPPGGTPVNIWVMNPDGSNQRQLTFSAAGVANVTPDWSPDGKRIAFTSTRTGDVETYVMNADGSNVVQLTNSSGVDQGPSWSPDGKQISFYSNRSGNFEIYVMAADGSNVRAVTNHPGVDQYPDWSPDGRSIAFQRDGDIYLVNLADGSTRLIFDAPIFSDMPEFSPNGKQLVFMNRLSGGGNSVYVVNIDDGTAVDLTPRPAGQAVWNNFFPSWSKNGQQVYFAGNQPPLTPDAEILVINADGTGLTRLTSQVGLNSAPVQR